jgi:dTDP-glucose 4,6-dehydratase
VTHAVVTGGAGFLGGHLCRRLLAEGWYVTCIDSFLTGDQANIADLEASDRFRVLLADVRDPIPVDQSVEWVFHLASPASPPAYLRNGIQTLEVGALGTREALELARRSGADFFLASTSEVYGDPKLHPQPESYWGNVNPIGPRSVYDEAKRFAEALTMAYQRTHGLRVHIARIFNTYGPGMRVDDGRAVPTFISNALGGTPLPIHGDGGQTRSLCFVDDLIEGIWQLARHGHTGPVNLGNPQEVSIRQLAELIRDLAGSESPLVSVPRPTDDPDLRRPDISLARRTLGWMPTVPLEAGLRATITWAALHWRAVVIP